MMSNRTIPEQNRAYLLRTKDKGLIKTLSQLPQVSGLRFSKDESSGKNIGTICQIPPETTEIFYCGQTKREKVYLFTPNKDPNKVEERNDPRWDHFSAKDQSSNLDLELGIYVDIIDTKERFIPTTNSKIHL